MSSKINSIVISLCTVVFSVMLIVMPKSDFSENENRSLADFPSFDADAVLSGDYMSDITEYLSDHFPMREKFVRLKNSFEIDVLGKKYINDIFIGKDGYFIEDYEKPENTEKIINNLNAFQHKINIKADIMLVPTQITVYADKLPKLASPLSQLKTIDEYYSSLDMNCIELYDAFMSAKDSEKLFYRLDHHWTTDGAYCAYVQYCTEKGFTPLKKSEFETEEIKDFKGTIYSKLNYENEYTEGETITLYKKNDDMTVSYDGKESNSLYNMDYADKKDKYSVFLNNINSFVEITNNSVKNGRTLAIAKDSYANSLIPFLAEHYSKIYVFDTRSYKGSVSEFINNNAVDDVLILYNVNTLDKDTGINAIY